MLQIRGAVISWEYLRSSPGSLLVPGAFPFLICSMAVDVSSVVIGVLSGRGLSGLSQGGTGV